MLKLNSIFASHQPVADFETICFVGVPLDHGLRIVGAVVQMNLEFELRLGHVILSEALIAIIRSLEIWP